MEEEEQEGEEQRKRREKEKTPYIFDGFMPAVAAGVPQTPGIIRNVG